MTDSTPDINTADDSDNILDGSMLVNSEPSSQSIGILTRILTLLNSGIVGKRLIGISALTLILLGSMKLYNFCLEINQEKLKNKHKIQEISKLVAKESRSDLIIDGLKSIMIKVNEINKSCSRYDHELKLLKKAKSSSEQVFIYLRYFIFFKF